ncbi:hypothetical protein V499_00368 [Pseudogymnoascus sp. VKM F-103]|nr:hypothetical protein V499_00368 [Pseudogymnoascus sp. VKM F-103]
MALQMLRIPNLSTASESDLFGYTYRQLPLRTSIRLLYVRSIMHGVIISDLKTLNLDDKPTYCCLSYTWGDPWGRDVEQQCFALRCNDRYILIRENLHNALCQLWKFARSDLKGIWIDAVCINQKDLDERAQQVNLMRRIYEEAVHITAWLGPEDDDSRCVAETLKPLELYLEKNPTLVNHCSQWILTELVEAFVSLKEPTFKELGSYKRPRYFQDLEDGVDKDGFIIVGILRQRYLEQRTSRATTSMPSAMSLLTRLIGKNFVATDDRDVVYSLKGILRDLDEINVDYSRSAVDLFEDVATRFIQESGSLDILAQASSQHRDFTHENVSNGGKRHRVGAQRRGWPSWVPNFAAASNAPSFDSIFDASAGMSVVWSKNDSFHRLQIYGVPIGRIQTRSEDMREIELGSIKRLLSMLSEMPNIYMYTGEYREEVFFRTLCGFTDEGDSQTDYSTVAMWLFTHVARIAHFSGPGSWGDANSAETQRRVEVLEIMNSVDSLQRNDPTGLFPRPDQVKIMLTELEKSDARLAEMISLHPDLANLSGKAHLMPEESLVAKSLAAKPLGLAGLVGNRLFKTDRGHLGSSSNIIQPGDVIWIIKGVKVPYVLRPTESQSHHLIGPAYVHGVMHGEAVRSKQGLNWEVIELE